MLASPCGSVVADRRDRPGRRRVRRRAREAHRDGLRRGAGVSVKVFRGTSVSDGVAAGEALVLLHGEVQVPEATIAPSQREKEIARLKRALAATRKDIETLEEETRDRIGDLSRLLTIYQTFLDDATLITPIVDAIRHQNLSAQTALHHVLRDFAQRFLKMGEPFANYAPELLDLERRVQARLLGNELVTLSRLPRPVVIIADELAPMQALAIDREKVLAFATETGSPESHTAILARHLGIPAVTGVRELTKARRPAGPRHHRRARGLRRRRSGSRDGAAVREGHPRPHARAAPRLRADAVPGRDGGRRPARGPVQHRHDRGRARPRRGRASRASGSFRTEFLYIGRTTPPDEDMQSAAYARAAQGVRLAARRHPDDGLRRRQVRRPRERPPRGEPSRSGSGRSGSRSSARTSSGRSSARSCGRRSTGRPGSCSR